jgi:hypothetical protein
VFKRSSQQSGTKLWRGYNLSANHIPPSVEQFKPVTKNFCSNNLDPGLFAVVFQKNGLDLSVKGKPWSLPSN